MAGPFAEPGESPDERDQVGREAAGSAAAAIRAGGEAPQEPLRRAQPEDPHRRHLHHRPTADHVETSRRRGEAAVGQLQGDFILPACTGTANIGHH